MNPTDGKLLAFPVAGRAELPELSALHSGVEAILSGVNRTDGGRLGPPDTCQGAEASVRVSPEGDLDAIFPIRRAGPGAVRPIFITRPRIGSQVHAGVLGRLDSIPPVALNDVGSDLRIGKLLDIYPVLAVVPDRVLVNAGQGSALNVDPVAPVALNHVWPCVAF